MAHTYPVPLLSLLRSYHLQSHRHSLSLTPLCHRLVRGHWSWHTITTPGSGYLAFHILDPFKNEINGPEHCQPQERRRRQQCLLQLPPAGPAPTSPACRQPHCGCRISDGAGVRSRYARPTATPTPTPLSSSARQRHDSNNHLAPLFFFLVMKTAWVPVDELSTLLFVGVTLTLIVLSRLVFFVSFLFLKKSQNEALKHSVNIRLFVVMGPGGWW